VIFNKVIGYLMGVGLNANSQRFKVKLKNFRYLLNLVICTLDYIALTNKITGI